MSDTNFQPGDVLEWRDRIVPGGQITKRMVSFREYRNNQCVVAWNLSSDGRGEEQWFTVPPENLSKPVTPVMTPAVAPRPEPAPSVPLDERRQILAHAYTGFREADEAVVNAQWLLDRALLRLEDVESHLRRFADLESRAVNAAVVELRHMNGGSTKHITSTISDEDDEQWQDRERAKREAGIAQQAYDTLARELSDTRMVFEDRLRVLHKAASFVLAGVVEREVQILAEIERRAIQVRARLRAAALIWVGDAPLPINEPANIILSNFPYDMGDPAGLRMELAEQRQEPFNDLLTRLMAGEIDADLPN